MAEANDVRTRLLEPAAKREPFGVIGNWQKATVLV